MVDTRITTFFSPTYTPALVSINDPNAVELRLKFSSSVSGEIIGVRFYKGAQNTGTPIDDLRSSAGALLASATFSNETATGWQEVDFSTPVATIAGKAHIVADHTNAGDFSADPNFFPDGPLSSPSSASSGGNGVFAYGASDLRFCNGET